MNTIETVVLNARGIKYEVLSKSLALYPNTRLGKLIKHSIDRDLNELSQICDNFNLDTNTFYFNRDPNILNMILNYYQSGNMHICQKECVMFIKDELEYWQLEEVPLEPCCNIYYTDKLADNEELIELGAKCLKSLYRNQSYGTFLPQLREKLWILFEEPKSSIHAQILFYFSILMICISTCILIIKTIPSLGLENDHSNKANETKSSLAHISNATELTCIVWFLIEFLLRFLCCPSKLSFIKSPLNIIDFTSNIPYLILLILSTRVNHMSSTARDILRMLRVLLLFKITRFSSSLQSFVRTLVNSGKELGILFVYVSIAMVFFSTIAYYCEKDDNPQFSSIPAAFWWGIITITTVGYGDVVLTTTLGKIIGSICALTGVLILAMPIGIISSKFTKTIENKKHEKHFLKLRNFNSNRYFNLKVSNQ